MSWLSSEAERLHRWNKRTEEWLKDNIFQLTLAFLILLFFAVYFSARTFISVYPGQAGVIWRRFEGGTDTRKTFYEGLHVISPWDEFYVYDMRSQQIFVRETGLTRDGLTVNVEASLRFRLVGEHLPELHKMYGPDYVNKIVRPNLATALQEVVSELLPENLYTVGRKSGQTSVFEAMKGYIGGKYVDVEELTLTRVELPAKVEDAVQSKLTEQQHYLEYQYRIERETEEAKRKVIEAQGIADAQKIVASQLTDRILIWKGIEATLELAKSPNSKVVVIGEGRGGLPVILGNLESGVK
jgi:regulator of protease activity HflC (stomatin/prohibitin superfamily)